MAILVFMDAIRNFAAAAAATTVAVAAAAAANSRMSPLLLLTLLPEMHAAACVHFSKAPGKGNKIGPMQPGPGLGPGPEGGLGQANKVQNCNKIWLDLFSEFCESYSPSLVALAGPGPVC